MTLTKNEEIFLSRAADVMVADPTLTPEQAMRAVLARDEELWLAATAQTEMGETIRHELSASVYRACRGEVKP